VTGDFFAAKIALEERLGEQHLEVEEALYLMGMFEPAEEHPETMRDFLKAFRAGYQAGYEDARIMFEGESL
jgi:hypothetical protein